MASAQGVCVGGSRTPLGGDILELVDGAWCCAPVDDRGWVRDDDRMLARADVLELQWVLPGRTAFLDGVGAKLDQDLTWEGVVGVIGASVAEKVEGDDAPGAEQRDQTVVDPQSSGEPCISTNAGWSPGCRDHVGAAPGRLDHHRHASSATRRILSSRPRAISSTAVEPNDPKTLDGWSYAMCAPLASQ
jgi:hypothetical protein